MFMFCGDIQNVVPVCTRVRKDEDAYDLLNKSVNSPEISDPTLMTQHQISFRKEAKPRRGHNIRHSAEFILRPSGILRTVSTGRL